MLNCAKKSKRTNTWSKGLSQMEYILWAIVFLVLFFTASALSNKRICKKLFIENYFSTEDETIEAVTEMANRPVFPSLNVSSITNARTYKRLNPDESVESVTEYFIYLWKTKSLMRDAHSLEAGRKKYTKEEFLKGLHDLIRGTT
jgi:hypothetical protein